MPRNHFPLSRIDVTAQEYADLAGNYNPAYAYYVDGMLRSIGGQSVGDALVGRHIYVHQTLGRPSGLFPLSGRTGYCTGRAPGVVRKVQFEVSSGENTATAFKGSFAVGAAYGDGANLKNAANANIALTPLTWGTTDPNDFGNPGGGASTANITGASGSDATYNTVEGRVFSDWMTVTPTKRIDFPTLGNPVTCRLYSTGQFPGSFGNDPPSGSGFGPNWNGAGEPEFGQGYFDGDQTTNANAVGAVNDPYGPTVRMRFLLDVPGQSHYSAGDSTVDGWSNGASIAAGATPGDIGGFVRKVRNWQIARGIPSSLCNGARAGRRSTLYLRMALREIMVNRFTHAWLLPWSINETGAPTASPYNIHESLDLTVQIMRACEIVGTQPILIEPVNSVGSGYQPAAVNAVLGPFLDAAEARGVTVFRTQKLLCDATGNLRADLRIDGAHPNEAGHQILLQSIVGDALKYGLY